MIVASAARVDTAGAQSEERREILNQKWQQRAWDFYDDVPEVRSAARYYSNSFARVMLVPAIRIAGADPTPMKLEGDPEHGYTAADALKCWEVLSRLKSPQGGQTEILRAFGLQLFVPGECYLTGREDEFVAGGERWDVYSSEELQVEKTSGDGRKFKLRRGGQGTAIQLPDDTVVIRVWSQHPRNTDLADSPVRSALSILQELVILTEEIQGAALSRLAGPGLFLLPNSAKAQKPPDAGKDWVDPKIQEMLDTWATGIQDPSSASRYTPVFMFVADEIYDKIGQDKLIQWGREADSVMAEQREHLLRRFRTAIDLPADYDQIAGTNHWCQTGDTEVLIRGRGWITQDALMVGDAALTLNHETGLSEWQHVQAIYRAEVTDEPLHAMRSKAHSSVSTSNHRWPIIRKARKVKGPRRGWTTTAEGFAVTDRIPLAAPLCETGQDAMKYADDFVRLVVAFTGDGTIQRHGNISIVKFADREIVEMRRILTSLFGPDGFREHQHRTSTVDGTAFILRQAEACDLLAICDDDKAVPVSFVDDLTPTQRRVFLDSCVEIGDGVVADSATVLYQVEPTRLDAFAYAAYLLGYKVTSGVRNQQTGFGKRPLSWVRWSALRSEFDPSSCEQTIEAYSGIVWCPTTANGTWFARHDGHTYYTGNSAWFIPQEAFSRYIEPGLGVIEDALTTRYFWPALTEEGMADPSRFVVWHDASGLITKPDRTTDAMAAHSAYLISDSATRREVGYSEDDAPTDAEIAQRIAIDQARRTSSSSTALPGSETQLPPTGAAIIASGGGIASLDRTLATMDAGLLRDLQLAADATMRRALEKANARIQSLAMKEPSLRGTLNGFTPANYEIIPALGPAVVKRLTAAEDPAAVLLDGGFDGLAATWTARTGRSIEELLRLGQQYGTLTDVEVAVLRAQLEEDNHHGWLLFLASLTVLATKLLYAPDGEPDVGEDDGALVPVGIVRSALARAGGGGLLAPGVPAASFLSGETIAKLWRAASITFEGWRWEYGDASRRTNFEPHRNLDGTEFTSWDDERLGNAAGLWPYVSHWSPGDHRGCSCLAVRTSASVSPKEMAA